MDEMGMTNKQFEAVMRLIKFITKIIFTKIDDEITRKDLEEELDSILQSILEDN